METQVVGDEPKEPVLQDGGVASKVKNSLRVGKGFRPQQSALLLSPQRCHVDALSPLFTFFARDIHIICNDDGEMCRVWQALLLPPICFGGFFSLFRLIGLWAPDLEVGIHPGMGRRWKPLLCCVPDPPHRLRVGTFGHFLQPDPLPSPGVGQGGPPFLFQPAAPSWVVDPLPRGRGRVVTKFSQPGEKKKPSWTREGGDANTFFVVFWGVF